MLGFPRSAGPYGEARVFDILIAGEFCWMSCLSCRSEWPVFVYLASIDQRVSFADQP